MGIRVLGCRRPPAGSCYCPENNHLSNRRRIFAAQWKVHIMSFRNFSTSQANSGKKPEANPAAIEPGKSAEPTPDTSAAAVNPAPHQGAND